MRRGRVFPFSANGKATEAREGGDQASIYSAMTGVAGLRPTLNNCLMNQKSSCLGVVTRRRRLEAPFAVHRTSSQEPLGGGSLSASCRMVMLVSVVGRFVFAAPGLSCSIWALIVKMWNCLTGAETCTRCLRPHANPNH